VERDPGAPLERELPALERRLAGQGPEQGRLARPVRAGERETIFALNLEGHSVEENIAGDLLPER
jgi:hypothetical protein